MGPSGAAMTLAPEQLAIRYPLLWDLSLNRGMPILPVYQKKDLMQLFCCCEKTIRRWSRVLPNRRLPNRGRCLPADIERFLECQHGADTEAQ